MIVLQRLHEELTVAMKEAVTKNDHLLEIAKDHSHHSAGARKKVLKRIIEKATARQKIFATALAEVEEAHAENQLGTKAVK